MEAEAAQGNTKAAEYQQEVTNDPRELIKLFKLSNARNRYAILSQMNSSDLEYLINFWTPPIYRWDLCFLQKEKILNLIYDLPKIRFVR